MRLLFFPIFVSTVLATACSVSTGGPGDPQSQNDAGTGGDSQAAHPDAGLPQPVPADVVVQTTCPASTAPCGGSVVGVWDYTGGCAEAPLDDVKKACPAATVSDVHAKVTGRVAFDALTVSRAFTSTYQATITVPASCATVAGGCAVVQKAMAPSFDSAACTDDGSGGCSCAVQGSQSNSADTGYTLQGNTVVTDDGNRYDYCVQGSTMSYQHVQGSSPEAGSFQLTKR